MFSVRTTLEEFENGGFTLKTHQMFSVHTMPKDFENGRDSIGIRILKRFRPHENDEKPRFHIAPFRREISVDGTPNRRN